MDRRMSCCARDWADAQTGQGWPASNFRGSPSVYRYEIKNRPFPSGCREGPFGGAIVNLGCGGKIHREVVQSEGAGSAGGAIGIDAHLNRVGLRGGHVEFEGFTRWRK